MPEHVTDVECPACDAEISIVTRRGDQLCRCPDCGAHFWAEYDAECVGEIGMPGTWLGGFILIRLPAPTAMDLSEHDGGNA